MEISYTNSLEQKQLLSQTQIQSLQVLSMDNVELDEFLQAEYLDNPILEYSASQTPPPSQDQNEKRYEIPAEDEYQLRDHLISQLTQWKFSEEEWSVLDFMIDSLDNNGFFPLSLEEAAHFTHSSEHMVDVCLECLRDLEPVGIFAQDLPHCLLKQLEYEGIEDPNLTKLILEHLPDIAEGKIGSIGRAMKLSTNQVRHYIAVISKLNPRPLTSFTTGKTEYIIPDIMVAYRDNQWEVSLNDNWMGDYTLNDYYMKMLRDTKDPELFEYFKKKLDRARFITNSIEQRRTTMLHIAEAILEYQKEYFMGAAPLKPMTMSEIADQIQMHTSTISRGIKGKYMQYPHGTIAMKDLFSAAVAAKDSDSSMTSNEVKKALKALIDAENKQKPLSDNALAKQLEEHDIHISRRTVAKYREELGIKGTFERKAWMES